tara:strand:+ start:6412 stop:7488 length:1077 start_codon:yes stop_codon:yes gene_type:complete
VAQKNLLLHLGKSSFGAQDGDGIQLEDTLHGKIILDGTQPLGVVNFIVQETNGDNIIAEDALQRSVQVNIIAEESIFSFDTNKVQNVGETLLQDNPIDVELITISDMDGIRIVDIIRNSKLLLENPASVEGFKLESKIIAEFDNVTPLKSETGRFLTLEEGTIGIQNPFAHLQSGQGDIDSGSTDDDGFELEGGGLIIGETGQRIISEQILGNKNFAQEANGIIEIEDYSPNSNVVHIEAEIGTRGTNGHFLALERSLQPEILDSVLLEDSDIDRLILDGTDSSSTDAGFKILYEIDFKDIDAQTNLLLNEQSKIFFDEGQIPHQNYDLSFNEGRPNDLVSKGSVPVTLSSVIGISVS